MANQVENVSSSSSDKPFLFLRLPEELRAMIYKHAVVSHIGGDNETPESGNDSSIPTPHDYEYAVDVSDGTGTHYYQPALSRTCHQIRAEFLPLFYSSNKFRFTIKHFEYQGFAKWSKSINPRFAQTIPALIVELSGKLIREPWLFLQAKEKFFNAKIAVEYLDEHGHFPEFSHMCAVCEKVRKQGQSWTDMMKSWKVNAMMADCIHLRMMLYNRLNRRHVLLSLGLFDKNDGDED